MAPKRSLAWRLASTILMKGRKMSFRGLIDRLIYLTHIGARELIYSERTLCIKVFTFRLGI